MMEKSSTGVIQVTDAEKFRDTFQDLFHAGNLDGLVSLFELEGAFVSPPGQVTVGPDAIRKVLADLLAIGGRLEFKDRSFHQVGDIALRVHEYQVEGSDPDGNPLTLRGVAAAVLRRQDDGCWRFVIDNASAFEEAPA
jgi:ketosteroid isomerase-like protein